MSNPDERNWTANIVISFDDPMLKVQGRALEDEIRAVLARVDSPGAVAQYLYFMMLMSVDWYSTAVRTTERK